MSHSRRSLRRSFAFAAATLAVLTLFAITPMISGDRGASDPVATAPF
jgi:hypothetical protein